MYYEPDTVSKAVLASVEKDVSFAVCFFVSVGVTGAAISTPYKVQCIEYNSCQVNGNCIINTYLF